MDILDWLLAPVYLVVFYLLAQRTVKKHGSNPLYGQYYMRGLTAKFISVFVFALVYIYYYKGGDSLAFYYSTSPTYKLFFNSPDIFFRFLIDPTERYPVDCLPEADSHGVMYMVRGSATLTTIRIAAFINLFCFNSYVVLCFVFAYISYMFQWQAFKLLATIYPTLHRLLAVSFLFIPSVLFWGSGLGKDSIMIGSVMLIFYCFYSAAILRQNIARNILLMIAAGYIVSLVRGFLLYTLVPSCMLMAVIYYQNSVKNTVLRLLIGPVLLLLGAVVTIFFIQNLGSSVSSYSIDSLQQKAEGFRSWHAYLGETQGGSSYSLGSDVEYTPVGILKQAPMAIIVTLFGPFIWQVRNPVMLLSALESLLLAFFTIRALINKRIYSLLGILVKDHIVVFCLAFVFTLSIAVGITSYNYGALVRYRIPVLPFYCLLLVLVNYRLSRPQE